VLCEEIIMNVSIERLLPLAEKSASGCSCCSQAGGQAPRDELQQQSVAPQAAATAEYRVAGMTCGHCASTVTAALSRIDEVDEVWVDLVPGGISTVTVAATAEVSEAAVGSAVAEAGYKLVTS
jgi:copper chaperone